MPASASSPHRGEGGPKGRMRGLAPRGEIGICSTARAAMNSDAAIDIAIIGGGIIGICAAAYLAEAGRSVTVFDRTGICEETSSGNAAAFAFSDVLPLAQKGMIKNLPKW